MAIKRIKKNISIQEETLNLGMVKAKELFGGNFSMYITYLINKDCKDIKENIKEVKEESKIDNEISCELDNILDM